MFVKRNQNTQQYVIETVNVSFSNITNDQVGLQFRAFLINRTIYIICNTAVENCT